MPITITANASVTVPGGAAVSSRVEPTTLVGARTSPAKTSRGTSTMALPASARSASTAASTSMRTGSRRAGAPGQERAP